MADIKAVIANILNVENSAGWKVYDSIPEKGLYLVHYEPNANMEKFGHLRGDIVDVNAKTKVCGSFPYTPVVKSDYIAPDPTSGMIRLKDMDLNDHILDPSRLKIKVGFEGTVMRVFKHDGVIYHSSHHKINAVNSRWGNSIPFLEMYYSLNGPADDVLFNPKSKYSPFCHIFMLVHPDVIVATKHQVGPGYMVYLGSKDMWVVDYDECPYKQINEDGSRRADFDSDPRPDAGWIDDTLHIPITETRLPSRITKPQLFDSLVISIEQANRHLKYGFYEAVDYPDLDPRLGTGEFVMLYYYTPDGDLEAIIRVSSTAHKWREFMRNDDPNLLHRLYDLVTDSYIRVHNQGELERLTNSFIAKYPIMSKYSIEDIRNHILTDGPFVVWPQLHPSKEIIASRDDRFYNLWECLLISVPLHQQLDVVSMYDEVIRGRARVIEWLRKLYDRGDVENIEYKRAKQIIQEAISGARYTTGQYSGRGRGRGISKSSRSMNFADTVMDNIRNFIAKEEGKSLYGLARDSRRAETPAV